MTSAADRIKRLWSFCRMAGGTLGSIAANHAGIAVLPRMAYLLLTWKCNLRCVMCGVWHKERFRTLDTAGYLKIIDSLPPLDIIKISGGEPFLRDDCAQIVGRIQKRLDPYYLMLITNGTFTDKVVDFVEQCGRPGLHLRLSLEGRGAVHDKLRGREGCFAKTMATLEALLPIMRRRGFTIGINYNVTSETMEDLPWIMELCRREGLNFIPGFWVKPFMEPGRPEDAQAMVDSFEDYSRLADKIYTQTKGLSFLEAFFLKRTVMQLYKSAAGQGSRRFACRACRNIAYIAPDGSLLSCGIKHDPLGCLGEQDFKSAWFGENMCRAREETDRCPGCCQYAIKIMSRVYTGQSFGLPAPSDWKEARKKISREDAPLF